MPLLNGWTGDVLNTHQSISTTLKTAYFSILNITIPYISEVWKIYCTETHPNTTTTTPQPSRSRSIQHLPQLIILSGNNATLSTTTINDHQPKAYFRKNHKKTPTPPINPPPSQPTISHYFPLTQPSHSSLKHPSPTPCRPPPPHNTLTEYIRPTKTLKRPQQSQTTNPSLSPTATPSPNRYITTTPLTEEPPYTHQDIQLEHPPHYRFEQPSHLQNKTPKASTVSKRNFHLQKELFFFHCSCSATPLKKG